MIPTQVRGPQAGGGQAGVLRVSGPMPLQVSGAGAYLPYQNGGTDIFSSMMPMIMMIMMMAMLMPMMKGFSKSD